MADLYDHLHAGYQSARGTESPGLEAISQRWNEQVQAGVGKPQSVLSQHSPSPIAANLSAPLLPNGYELPNTAAGSSSETAQKANYLRLQGEDAI
jgi:hypothetical protein